MISLYLFAVLVGGALLVVSMLGSHDHGHHGDIGHHDGHFGGGHDAHHPGDIGHYISLRTLTYFLFVFGGVGGVLSWKWGGPGIASFIIALIAGLGVAGLAGASFNYLSRTDSGYRDSEDSFVGLSGRVVVPIASGGMGKVQVVRGDRCYDLLARPLNGDAEGMSTWKSVIVVEMNRGTALVMPLDDPALQEGSS